MSKHEEDWAERRFAPVTPPINLKDKAWVGLQTSKTQQYQFLVTITSTEPPPGQTTKHLEKLTREMELMYGANATVEVYPWPPITGPKESQ